MRIPLIFAVFIATVIASEAHAVALYRATRLDFSATTLNDRGQIIGENGAGTVLWRKGESVQLGVSGAVDINDRGTVLGKDWLLDRHGLTQGAFSGAVALNNRGEVAGNLPRDRAFFWDPKNGLTQIRVDQFGFPEESSINVNGLADDGTVLLSFDLWNGSYGIWKGESDHAPLPMVLSDCCINTHAVINGRGDIAGVSLTGPTAPDLPPGVPNCGFNGCYVVATWDSELEPAYVGLQSLADISFPEHVSSRSGVTGINDDLLIVGSYQSFEHFEGRAYFGSAELGILDLNELLTRQARSLLGSATLRSAQGINDRGWILAKTREGTSYLLRPVPEPSTLTLVFIGAVVFVGARRYRLKHGGADEVAGDGPTT